MQRVVTIERRRLDPHKLYGVIVAESSELVLLHEEYDLMFNGYCVLRRRDITKQYTSETNDYQARIMKEEGLWERAPRRLSKLPLGSWADVLKQFVGTSVILENEREDGFFYLGPVIEVSASAALVHPFDGCGRWLGQVAVPFRKITSMRFGDRYATLHAKHLKK